MLLGIVCLSLCTFREKKVQITRRVLLVVFCCGLISVQFDILPEALYFRILGKGMDIRVCGKFGPQSVGIDPSGHTFFISFSFIFYDLL